MQENVFQEISSEKLQAYAVWEPILRTDDERSSRKATTLFPDPRVRNYWVKTQEVGVAFQPTIGLTTEPAWDVYLLYPPGVTWEGAVPPEPTFFMHQLSGRLPHGQRLDGPKLAEAIRQSLLQ